VEVSSVPNNIIFSRKNAQQRALSIKNIGCGLFSADLIMCANSAFCFLNESVDEGTPMTAGNFLTLKVT
jgi:hypothetical protein